MKHKFAGLVGLLMVTLVLTTVAEAAEPRARTPVMRPMLQAPAIQPAQGMPRARATQRLSRAQIAHVLSVAVSALSASIVLEPARLKVGSSIMELYCPIEVLPQKAHARFTQTACQGIGMVAISFKAAAGKRYLLDCAGTPANQTWRLKPWGVPSSGSTVSGTEHPAFVHDATKNGIVRFALTGSAPSYVVQRCEITPTQ